MVQKPDQNPNPNKMVKKKQYVEQNQIIYGVHLVFKSTWYTNSF